MFVVLGGEIGRAMSAVVWIPARPVQPGDGRAILTEGNGGGSQQPGLGSVEYPGENRRMESDRGDAKAALPACGRGIQLLKHEDFPIDPNIAQC